MSEVKVDPQSKDLYLSGNGNNLKRNESVTTDTVKEQSKIEIIEDNKRKIFT